MSNPSPFEMGLLVSLASLVAVVRATPGFDGAALTKAAEYFIANPGTGCTTGAAKEAYESALKVISKEHENILAVVQSEPVRH
ncbi:MAG: hypothetical protein QOI97_1734 [Pseudomonas sp.]|jgi:hypothetical protein|nr:hypothetical protein [Pseudomonas sp.]